MTSDRLFFSESQIELVTEILNRIIPPNDKMPGAGAIAVDYLDQAVGGSVRLRQIFSRGLAHIEVRAYAAYADDFTALSEKERDAVLRRVETDDPEYFETLVRQTYNGYYTNPSIIELLGLEARPPQPRGHLLEQGNLSLLENVRKRGIAYREV